MNDNWLSFLLGDLLGDFCGLGLSGMKGASVDTDSCFCGDFTVYCFLGEFSFDSFLPNSFVGDRFFSLVNIDYPKVSG